MSSAAPSRREGPSRADPIVFQGAEFEALTGLVRREFGLHIDPSKQAFLQSRLGKRLRDLGLKSFRDYHDLLHKGDGDERARLISALTTNVTQFYREGHHFDLLEQSILPPLIARARAGGRVRLWSAGCSSGQEPYSLAASVIAVASDIARHDLKILATDIDTDILEMAREAKFAEAARKFPSPALEERVFARQSRTGPLWPVRPALKDLVSFRQLNLNGAWPISGRFDVILCRNVAIYFDRETQERLWSRFADALAPGGVLMIGHSERISGAALARFESAGITTYRKRDRPPLTQGEN